MKNCALALLLAVCLAAQSSAPRTFTAVSVKPDTQVGSITLQWKVDPTHLHLEANPLRSYLTWAYGLEKYQLQSPDWAETERFNIDATTEAPATTAEMKTMLQAVLVNRFGLAFHTETKNIPVYLLTVAKPNPGLVPVPPQAYSGLNGFKDHLVAAHATLADFARFLSLKGAVDRPVLDQTNLTGAYDFTLNYRAGDDPTAASIFTALTDQH